MTKTFFILPGVQRSTLSCVWFDTGNPAQPLACMWIDRDLHTAAAMLDRSTPAIVNRKVTSIASARPSGRCIDRAETRIRSIVDALR